MSGNRAAYFPDLPCSRITYDPNTRAESCRSAAPQKDGKEEHRDGFDLAHLQYPQIGLLLPKPKKGIMVGAEVLGHPRLPSNGAVEHPAKCDTVDSSGLDAEPDDPAGILIHDDQDPVGQQGVSNIFG